MPFLEELYSDQEIQVLIPFVEPAGPQPSCAVTWLSLGANAERTGEQVLEGLSQHGVRAGLSFHQVWTQSYPQT